MIRLSLGLCLMPVLPPKHIRLRYGAEDLTPPQAHEVIRGSEDAPQVLPHQLASGLTEDNVDLLQGLVLGLWHEEQLVDPAHDSDAAIEAQG